MNINYGGYSVYALDDVLHVECGRCGTIQSDPAEKVLMSSMMMWAAEHEAECDTDYARRRQEILNRLDESAGQVTILPEHLGELFAAQAEYDEAMQFRDPYGTEEALARLSKILHAEAEEE